MAKKREDNSVTVDKKVVKLMYKDYSVALKWAEFLRDEFSWKLNWDTERALENHINYLKARKQEFWEQL